ncbi:MAG: hypothetical protein KF817_05060 [Phycisphaeraceae bacterium]|nr:hypothetical protein [Phycisphaeraceae bacterium]
MLPKMPAPVQQPGFLFVPPFRIQGYSIAGEHTVIQVPELDVCFDIGSCPRFAISSPFIALSHTHMDHVGGLPYYFSQRVFQKMGPGTVVCHPEAVEPLRVMMRSWGDLERQRTQHAIVPLEPGRDLEIKPNIVLRAIEVSHTIPALGFALVERRSKLRPEFAGLPQERLRQLRAEGVEITQVIEIPLIAYTGDTEFGPFLFRDEFSRAATVICECTFVDPGHRDRAAIGKHLHLDDIAKLIDVWEARTIILGHLSRRSHIGEIRRFLRSRINREECDRLHLLMDHRANRERYEQQALSIGAAAAIEAHDETEAG